MSMTSTYKSNSGVTLPKTGKVLPDLAAQNAAILAELDRLRAENAALLKAKEAKAGRIWFKVQDKGGFSVYGLGRFPVTLYKSQWQRLFSVLDQVKAAVAQLPDRDTD